MGAFEIDHPSLFKSGIMRANALEQTVHLLKSEISGLDEMLGGGLSFGSISEWGLPIGQGGRELILPFLVSATQGRGLSSPLHCLWVSSASASLSVYPPAWAARGVDLSRMRFTKTSKAVRDLKPLFVKPVFKVIVFDSPEKLSPEDVAFISGAARTHQMLILILRNYLLSPERPNVWSKLRLNARRSQSKDGGFQVEVIRGQAPLRAAVGLRRVSDL